MRGYGHTRYGRWGCEEADEFGDGDIETHESEASDSDSSSEDGHMQRFMGASVVPRCKRLQQIVAYIVPTAKGTTDIVVYNIVYTNSSALPLLVPIQSKHSRGG